MPALIAGAEIDVVKFDLDGTMVGYLPAVLSAARMVLTTHLAARGKVVTLDPELFRGRPVIDASRDVLEAHGFHADDGTLGNLFWQHHDAVNADLRTNGLSAKSGLIPVLRRLKDEGLRTCVVSSNTDERIKLCLELADIATYFQPEHRYSSYWPHIEGHKPHPAIYRYAIENQQAVPGRCVAIEDSVHGVMAAVAANIGVVIGYVGDYYPETVRPAAREKLFAAGATLVINHWNEFPHGVGFTG